MAENVFSIKINGVQEYKLALATMDKSIRERMGQALFRAGVKVQARAQEIITEKRHVITGNLRRSILTEVHIPDGGGYGVRIFASEAELESGFESNKNKVKELEKNGKNVPKKFENVAGTFVYYAAFVELLPDGGFLLPATLEKSSEVIADCQAVVEKAIQEVDRKGKRA
jgi:hypothetical protein